MAQKPSKYDLAWHLLGDEGWNGHGLGRKFAVGAVGFLAIKGGDIALASTGNIYVAVAASTVIGLGAGAFWRAGMGARNTVRDVSVRGEAPIVFGAEFTQSPDSSDSDPES